MPRFEFKCLKGNARVHVRSNRYIQQSMASRDPIHDEGSLPEGLRNGAWAAHKEIVDERRRPGRRKRGVNIPRLGPPPKTRVGQANPAPKIRLDRPPSRMRLIMQISADNSMQTSAEDRIRRPKT
jgi:hypothetical protein